MEEQDVSLTKNIQLFCCDEGATCHDSFNQAIVVNIDYYQNTKRYAPSGTDGHNQASISVLFH